MLASVIRRVERVLGKLRKRGDKRSVHHKQRRLESLRARLAWWLVE